MRHYLRFLTSATKRESRRVGRRFANSQYVRSALLVIALLTLALVLLMPGLEAPGPTQDEGLLLVYPERLLAGDLPYRDFEYTYGPGAIGLLAGMYALTGPGMIAERLVGLMYCLAIILAVFCCARRWGKRTALTAGLLSSIFLSLVGLTAYAWLGGLALSLWSLWALDSRRYRTAGLLAGLALLFRLDLAVAITAPAVVLLLHASLSRWWEYGRGAIIGVLPYLALLVGLGPAHLIDGLVVTPVFFVGPGRRLPLDDLAALLLLLVVTTAVLIAGGIREAREGDPLMLALGACSVGILPQAFQRADLQHWAFVACVTIGLLPIPIANLAARVRGVTAIGGAMMVVLLGLAGAIAWTKDGLAITHVDRSFVVETEHAIALQAVLDDIDRYAQPGYRIFIGTRDLRRTFIADTVLYHLLPHLTPATYFLELSPGSANRPGTRLAEDIATADILILSSWYERPTNTSDGSRAWLLRESELAWRPGDGRAQQVVDRQFCLLAEYARYQILGRCR